MIIWAGGATIWLLNSDEDSLLAELLTDELTINGVTLELALADTDDDTLALADRVENDDALVILTRETSFFGCCEA